MPETPQEANHCDGSYKQTYSRLDAVGVASHATLSNALQATSKLPLNAQPMHLFEQLAGGDAIGSSASA